MSNTKFTPGPWKVQHSESKPAFNVIGTLLGGKYKIARCPYVILQEGEAMTKINDRELIEAEANAKLIAAAPELLDALEDICGKAYNGLGLTWKVEYTNDLHEKIKAAIKKATE